VYAAEAIPPRRKVIEYTGERLTPRQFARRFRKNERMGARRKSSYFARLNRYWILDGGVGGSGAQFVNHCCDPNLAARTLRGHQWLVSRRSIRRGEELTVDYNRAKNAPRTPCRCGSLKCRGTINRS
jgi:SET domain-containing protein